MYMGHLGLALAAKGLRPRVPLWVTVTATLASDLLDVAAGLVGIESSAVYPWSHSLLGGLVLALITALAYAVEVRNLVSAGIVGAVAFSHVLLGFQLFFQSLPIT